MPSHHDDDPKSTKKDKKKKPTKKDKKKKPTKKDKKATQSTSKKGKSKSSKSPSSSTKAKKSTASSSQKKKNPKAADPSSKGKEPKDDSSHYDVAIVGGGLSGLTTAYYLLQGNPSLRVGVFEAASVLGGRTYSTNVGTGDGNEIPVSIGGTWVMLEDWATLALSRDVKCMPYKPKLSVQHITPKILGGPLLFLRLFLLGMEIMKESPDGGEWWNSPKAKKLDSISLNEWLDNQLLTTHFGRQAIRSYFILIENFQNFSAMSVLWAAVCLYVRLFVVPKGIITHFHLPSTMRWHGGTGAFVDSLVGALEEAKAELVPSTLVTHIDQSDASAVRVTLHGQEDNAIRTISASRVVVASSISAAVFGIKYTPALPEFQSTVGQSVIGSHFASLNVVLMYESDWWTEKGQAMAILPDLLVDGPRDDELTRTKAFGEVMDLTDEKYTNKATGKPYGVVRILSNPGSVAGRTDEQIKDHAIHFLQHYYDKKYHDDIANISNYMIWRWTDRSPTLPAVTFQFSVGIMSYYGDYMRKPFDRVYWAGSERAKSGFNWMEGAIQRGMKVAAGVAESLEEGASGGHESYWGQMPKHIHNRLNQTGLEPPPHLLEAYDELKDPSKFVNKHPWDFSEEFRAIRKLGEENEKAARGFLNHLKSIDPDFSPTLSRLIILVHNAKHLPTSFFEGGDVTSKPDPYVVVRYDHLRKRTSSKANEKSPVWNEKIRIPLPFPGDKVEFDVKNSNFLLDTTLGSGHIELDEAMLEELKNGKSLSHMVKLGGKKAVLNVSLSVELESSDL